MVEEGYASKFSYMRNYFLKKFGISKTIKGIFFYNYRLLLRQFINQKNEKFLSQKQMKLLNYYKKIAKNDNCIQNITNQAALPYLLDKPSCTRYYTNWYLITNKHQKKFIDEIVEKKPRLILYWAKLDLYNFDDEKRMPYIQNYLLNNYVTYDKTEDWHFLLKK